MVLDIIIKILAVGVPALLIILGWISATTGNMLLGVGMIVVGILIYIGEAVSLR